MTSEPTPQITNVSQTDNAAVVTFDNEETVIYPANVLQATKEVARVVYEVDRPLNEPRKSDTI